ncbi:MAG: signal peptide peptidase SppA [Candidatus Binatia bacterium]
MGSSLRRWVTLAVLGAVRWLRRAKPYGVVSLIVSGPLAEEPAAPRLLAFLRRPPGDYFGLLTLLRWARDDPRLQGVLIRLDDIHASWARVQELRRAVERLRAAGKRVWIHLERAGIHEYYLAAAAERVSLAPAATLDVTGLSSESIFLREALNKVGVEAELVQIGRYKSAGEMLTRDEMSPAHREMLQALVDDLYEQVVAGVAAERGVPVDAVRDQLGRGPFVACEARDAGLVDTVAYADEIEQQLADACGGAVVIEGADYAAQRGPEVRRQALRSATRTLALLHVDGSLKPGESVTRPGVSAATGAASIGAALKQIRERDDISALVLRIASPGGSALASDLIWREVERTRAAKPVVVSCGDVAASGGYYIAIAGHPVFAEAGSITGSIGVLAGKATLRGLYNRLGVRKQLVGRGDNAGLFSDYVPLNEHGRDRLRRQAEAFYSDFIDKVARARGLSAEAVHESAQGRIWTGRQAHARGLVDALGGLEDAIDAAKLAVGLAPELPVFLERFPKPKRLWDLSLNLGLPRRSLLTEMTDLAPAFGYLLRERVWAVLPFRIRFF